MTEQNTFNLEGKVALVTGASGAIGRDISLALAKAGADIIVSGRNSERLKKTAELVAECGRKFSIIAADLSDRQEVQKLAQASVATFDHVDILVNNAAANVFKKAERFTETDFDLIINTNVKGAFFLSQCFAQHMLSIGGGSIIFITSQLGQTAMNFACLYGATKAALMQITRSLAFEWAKYNIRVNSVSPGPWATGMLEPLFRDGKTEEALTRLTPSRRLGAEGDLGGAVVFLVSEAARHITGQDLIVDGGFSICKIIP
ncbi:MAG: glucose 1-dehydrogenase [Desulfobacterales bacterium]|nr:MAG: glucose 1-dehydrogenase [Desulfobacterales bacterium]